MSFGAWLSRFSLRTQMLSGFLAVAVVILGFGLISLRTETHLHARTQTLVNDRVVPLEHLKTISDAYAVAFVDASHKLRAGTLGWDAALAEMRRSRGLADSLWGAYLATYLTSEEKALVSEAERRFIAGHAAADTLMQIVSARDSAALVAFVESRLYPAIDPLTESLGRLVTLQVRVAREELTAGVEEFSRTRAYTAALILATMAMAIGLGWFYAARFSGLARRLATQLQQVRQGEVRSLRAAFEAIARGDLSATVVRTTTAAAVEGEDEFAALTRDVNGILAEVHATGAEYANAVEQVRTAVAQCDRAAHAAQRGAVEEQVSATGLHGAFAELVQAMGATLAAIRAPIEEARDVLAAAAERDLSQRMVGAYEGAFRTIGDSVNGALDTLGNALREVQDAAVQVQSAAEEIADASQGLSTGSVDQAGALDQATGELTGVASVAAGTAHEAALARSAAAAARTEASGGVQRMQRLTDAIARIQSSSEQTSRIIRTIDELAFQTNLLSLNAAVEAARAGDAGRGFAVVAEEVRALALRSAEAARTIGELLAEATRHAQDGTAANTEVLSSLEAIQQKVEEVSRVLDHVTDASASQATQVSAVNATVDRISQVTQATAAHAEESASAAQELSAQATQLREIVERFVIGDASITTVSVSTSPPRRAQRRTPLGMLAVR